MKRRFLYDHGVNADAGKMDGPDMSRNIQDDVFPLGAPEPNRELTYGDRMVASNPDGSPSIPDINHAAAQLIDVIKATMQRFPDISEKRKAYFDQAEMLALQSKMLAVKAATHID